MKFVNKLKGLIRGVHMVGKPLGHLVHSLITCAAAVIYVPKPMGLHREQKRVQLQETLGGSDDLGPKRLCVYERCKCHCEREVVQR